MVLLMLLFLTRESTETIAKKSRVCYLLKTYSCQKKFRLISQFSGFYLVVLVGKSKMGTPNKTLGILIETAYLFFYHTIKKVCYMNTNCWKLLNVNAS